MAPFRFPTVIRLVPALLLPFAMACGNPLTLTAADGVGNGEDAAPDAAIADAAADIQDLDSVADALDANLDSADDQANADTAADEIADLGVDVDAAPADATDADAAVPDVVADSDVAPNDTEIDAVLAIDANDAATDAAPLCVPATETCNGKDDNCDGVVDEPATALCEDDNVCTYDLCLTGACVHPPVAGACDDGNACTNEDHCEGGACTGKPLNCDDGFACTLDTCDPASPAPCVHDASGACGDGNVCTDDSCSSFGCTHLPNAATCSDGDACTTADSCAAGGCVPGTPLACDDGSSCTSDACDKAIGCVHVPLTGPCDDGDACSIADQCVYGVCVGKPKDCGDGEDCTADSCDANVGCVNLALSGTCSDGDACTLGDACSGGTCHAGSPANCDDGSTCTTDACDAKLGCVHAPLTGTCDDGNACSDADLCIYGICVGQPKACSDGDVCTTDECTPGTGCSHGAVVNGSACSDGNPCTTGDACMNGTCQANTLDCSDDEPCTQDGCDPTLACTHKKLSGGACDDGDACTTGDTCLQGQCKGTTDPCNDANVCTTDSCNPLTGCLHVGLPAGACADGNVCTDDSCSPALGCVHAANSASCEDSDPCTESGTCKNGACVGGPVAAFDATYGTTANESARAVAWLGDGFALAGTTSANGSDDAYVVRTTADGKLLWSKTFGGFNSDTPSSVAAFAGGIVFAGTTASSGNGGNDGWLVRTDGQGKAIWNKAYGTQGNDSFAAVSALPDGIAAAGSTWDGANWGNRGWLLRTDSAGDVSWQHIFNNTDTFSALVALPDGFALAGGSPSTLVRTDATGTELWRRSLPGDAAAGQSGLAVLPDGFALVGKIVVASGESDIWLVRTDAQGAVLWSRTYATGYAGTLDAMSALVALPDGFAMAGTNFETGANVWLLRTDPLGGTLWDRKLGGNADDKAYAMAALPDGLAIAGSTQSQGAGGSDMWLVRTDSWGASSCSDSGSCATNTASLCDDKDPCTADICTAADGCVHTPVAASCDVTNACQPKAGCTPQLCGTSSITLFEATYGGGGKDVAAAVVALDDGFALAGTTMSKGAGGKDFWLVRTNTQGTRLWDKTYGDADEQTLAGMAALPNGIALAGNSGPPSGDTQPRLFGTDAQGSVLWQAALPTMQWGAFQGLVAVQDGLAAAGYAVTSGSLNAWLLRTDASGQVQWSQFVGTDLPTGLGALADGFALTGNTVVRTDAAGQPLWQKQYGFTSRAVVGTADGGLVLSGVSGSNTVLACTDALGTLLWQRNLVTWYGDGATALLALPYGYAIGGTSIADNATSAGRLLVTDFAGKVQWDRTFDHAGTDTFAAIAGLNDGLVAAGTTDSWGSGVQDAWLVRLDSWGDQTCEAAGSCLAKTMASCDDGSLCTQAQCDATQGCSNVDVSAGCNDGNVCTTDSCDPTKGCLNGFNSLPCDDGMPCTSPDACVGGACVGTGPHLLNGVSSYAIAWNAVAVVNGGYIFAGGNGGYGMIARTDLDAQLVWQQFESSYNGKNQFSAIATQVDGLAFAGTKTNSAGNTDGWLLRTDLAGNTDWVDTYGGGGTDGFAAMAALSDGYLLAGSTTSKGAGAADGWLVRTDASGNTLWDKTYGTASTESFGGLVPLPDGFALAGTAAGLGWLVRMDANGVVQWQRALADGVNGLAFNGVVALADGFALTGTRTSGSGTVQLWLTRTNAAGYPIWGKTYDSASAGNAIALLPDGFAVAGTYAGSQFYALRTDFDGTMVSSRSIASTWWGTTAAGNAVVALPDGVLTVGVTNAGGGYTPAALLLRTDRYGQSACTVCAVTNCDDGSVCTRDGCDGQSCTHPAGSCDDGNVCTNDACDPQTGCTHVANTAPCDDGSACTTGDNCANGVCTVTGVAPWNVTNGGKSTDSFAAVAVLPDGYVAVGSNASRSNGVANAWLVRMDNMGKVLWDRTYSTLYNKANAVLAQSDGIVFAGTNGTDSGQGVQDASLRRTDLQGVTTWERTYGGVLDDQANALVAVSGGGFALGGSTRSKGAGQMDMWLVRTDANGNFLWDNTYGTSLGEYGFALAALDDGFLVAGMNSNDGWGNGWIVRTDVTGAQLWQKNIGTDADYERFNAVVALPDGFALAGMTSTAMWLVRTDLAGNVAWQQKLASVGPSAAAYGLAALGNGFALTGYGQPTLSGATDEWLVRTDLSGNARWNRYLGGTGSDRGLAIQALTDGFVVAGLTSLVAGNSDDAWLIRTDAWGNASCSASGICAQTLLNACDDSEPCTTDTCDAAHNGCWHGTLADGTVCGVGKTCSAGVCQ